MAGIIICKQTHLDKKADVSKSEIRLVEGRGRKGATGAGCGVLEYTAPEVAGGNYFITGSVAVLGYIEENGIGGGGR